MRNSPNAVQRDLQDVEIQRLKEVVSSLHELKDTIMTAPPSTLDLGDWT